MLTLSVLRLVVSVDPSDFSLFQSEKTKKIKGKSKSRNLCKIGTVRGPSPADSYTFSFDVASALLFLFSGDDVEINCTQKYLTHLITDILLIINLNVISTIDLNPFFLRNFFLPIKQNGLCDVIFFISLFSLISFLFFWFRPRL